MRNRTILIVVLLSIVLGPLVLDALEISEAEILFNGDTLVPECLNDGDVVELRVIIKGADDSAYIGATIIDPEGDQINIDVVPVICYSDAEGKSTYTTASLDATITEMMNSADSSSREQKLRIVYRLWDTRVPRDECENLGVDGDLPCDWCREYSYHMEDPVGLAISRGLAPYCPIDEIHSDDPE